jgi:hypothetical protein
MHIIGEDLVLNFLIPIQCVCDSCSKMRGRKGKRGRRNFVEQKPVKNMEELVASFCVSNKRVGTLRSQVSFIQLRF